MPDPTPPPGEPWPSDPSRTVRPGPRAAGLAGRRVRRAQRRPPASGGRAAGVGAADGRAPVPDRTGSQVDAELRQLLEESGGGAMPRLPRAGGWITSCQTRCAAGCAWRCRRCVPRARVPLSPEPRVTGRVRHLVLQGRSRRGVVARARRSPEPASRHSTRPLTRRPPGAGARRRAVRPRGARPKACAARPCVSRSRASGVGQGGEPGQQGQQLTGLGPLHQPRTQQGAGRSPGRATVRGCRGGAAVQIAGRPAVVLGGGVQRPAALALDEPADPAEHLARTPPRPAPWPAPRSRTGAYWPCRMCSSACRTAFSAATHSRRRSVSDRSPAGPGEAPVDVPALKSARPTSASRAAECGPVASPSCQRARSWGRDRSGASLPPPNHVVCCPAVSRAPVGMRPTA